MPRRSSFVLVLIGSLTTTLFSGCLSWLESPLIVPPEVQESCQQIHEESRGKLYVFLLNGLDPLSFDALDTTRDYLNRIGFNKTYCGQKYHTEWFGEEIRKLHHRYPEARFAIIGYDTGAEAARQLAQAVGNDGVRIDLLIYLQPRALAFPLPNSLTPTRKVIAIHNQILWNKDVPLEGAEIIALPEVGHYQVPRHPVTVERITKELATIGLAIPFRLPVGEAFPPVFEELPIRPREIENPKTKATDDWDFLKATENHRIRDDILTGRSLPSSKENP